MKQTILTLGLSSTLLISQHALAEKPMQADLDQSHKIVKQFMGSLKGELMAAMKAGGPQNALKVCNTKAPIITTKMSSTHKMDVSRTSLKARNSSNTPDAWEMKVLQQFETRKQSGEAVKPMEYAEVVNNNGAKKYRYMKAIPTAKPCLTCHGQKVDEKLLSKINSLYPNDKAIGFKLGDIRGAFSITKNLN